MSRPNPSETDAWTRVDYEALAGQVERLEAKLEAHGIRVPGSSRLALYRRTLEKTKTIPEGASPPEDLDVKILHQAVYDSEQVSYIVDELSRSPEVQGWTSAVKELVSGTTLPAEEQTGSRARDLQFELYMAALSRAAGYGVQLAEPDVVVNDPRLTFGLAAKRPRSVRRLDKTVKKAGRQITASAYDGLLALDITLLQNPESMYAIVTDPEIASGVVRHSADRFLDRNVGRIRSLVDPTRVFGVIIHMATLFFDRQGQRLGSAFRISSGNLCEQQDWRFSVLNDFMERVGAEATSPRGAEEGAT